MYLGQAMGICPRPGLMNIQTFDTSGTPYNPIELSYAYAYLA